MTVSTLRKPTIIMGAAGRDFHNFNVVYRDNPATEVIAFTAAQVPETTIQPPGNTIALPLIQDQMA